MKRILNKLKKDADVNLTIKGVKPVSIYSNLEYILTKKEINQLPVMEIIKDKDPSILWVKYTDPDKKLIIIFVFNQKINNPIDPIKMIKDIMVKPDFNKKDENPYNYHYKLGTILGYNNEDCVKAFAMEQLLEEQRKEMT